MARVGIYNAALPTLGGGELYTLAVAGLLAKRGDTVEILTRPGVTLSVAAERFGISDGLDDVTLTTLDPLRHAFEAGERSEEYELFVNCNYVSRTPSRAARGLLVPWFPAAAGTRAGALDFVGTYDRAIAVSDYVAGWIREWWDIEPGLVHPPVAPIAPGPERERSIVVVGRFQDVGHPKRQLELVQAFAEIAGGAASGWRLELLGGVEPQNWRYLEAVHQAAAGLSVDIHVDLSRALLEDRVGRASIVWQATGWGCDRVIEPHAFEHFGIGLVEAMSAGAVPVALETGGPGEIVRDGVDGFTWRAGDGPLPATVALIEDPMRLQELSVAARARAREFGPERFEADFSAVVDAL
jgi:glycosyltransferase involved in cell wall biosynthesis